MKKILSYLILLGLLVQNFAFLQVFAAAPTTRTTISIKKTGSEPFDANTWDGNDLTTAGYDSDENNNVVRLQDSITYQVELSANDADIDNLIATVILDKKQEWINIPTGCKTSGVTPASSISADKTILTCNTGFATEGTNKIIFPTSRVLQASKDGTEVVLNDDRVSASVTVYGDGSNASSDTSDEIIVTSNFKVDTVKELYDMRVNSSGDPIYRAPYQKGPNGEDGSLIEYRIKSTYIKGSMLANSPNESGGNFETNYILYDYFSDDNTNNDGGNKSSNIKLFDWVNGIEGCELIGNHGPNASISCTQVDVAADGSGPNGTPDGINDPNIKIQLNNIDVRDPDSDGNLIELKIKIWVPRDDDILTHQNCQGTVCDLMTINGVGELDGSSFKGFNPISTEDKNGNNLPNYNGNGEPFPNLYTYQLTYRGPGTWATYMAFYGVYSTTKQAEQFVALGDTVKFYNDVYDYRDIDGTKSQTCTKIDKSQYEYKGLVQNQTDMGWWPNNQVANPNTPIWGGANPIYSNLDTTGNNNKMLYSNKALNTLSQLHDQNCEDDLNGDGKYVIDGINQSNGNADSPSDWYTDPTSIGGLEQVSIFRQENTYNKSYVDSIDPTHKYYAFTTNYLLKIKDTATGYGSKHYLPLFMSSRTYGTNGTFGSWYNDTSSVDPENLSFSYSSNYSDRNILVPSSYSLEKYTSPRGIKVVRAGDVVDFIVEPKLKGLWTSNKSSMSIVDSIPAGTNYVVGSEMFSTDGGTTWKNRSDYLAGNPAVGISSAANTDTSTLTWNFTDVTDVDKAVLVKYSVSLDKNLTKGEFINTATLNGGMGADKDGDGNPDDIVSSYKLTILPEYGFDVSIANRQDVYSTNTPFVFDLNYKNLGGENYANGEFINILPFNGDGAGNISGLASNRTPASRFNGTYKLSKLTGTNSEVFYATTDVSTSIQNDPCHEDNQAAGYVPISGDLCYTNYKNNGDKFTGGSATGTANTNWVECSSVDPVVCGGLDPKDITGIRFKVASVPSSGGKIVSVELTPEANLGGTPNIDNLGNVTTSSTGDIYTNTFSGRVPEISLLIISNDASVTMVSGSIGDRLYFDNNNSGTEDAGDTGIENVKLSIFDSNGNPVYIDPVSKAVVDSSFPGAVVYTTITDSNGNYIFENLPSGEYTVEIDNTTLPEHVLQTYDPDSIKDGKSTHTLTTTLDNDGNLLNIEDNTDQDFGYLPLSSIGDTVWEDINADGIQDSDEPGFEGVKVNLLDSTGNVIKTTTTDSNGKYIFEDLIPGEYKIEVVLPADTGLSDKTQGTDINKDSDVNILTSKTDTINLVADEDKTDIDVGIYKFASIGNKVWDDSNADGKQDSDEVGIENVVVNLLDTTGNIVKTTTTDSNGEYIFENLKPGEYIVEVIKPTKYIYVPHKDTGDITNDSNTNHITGKTDVITLVSDEENMDIDSALVLPASIGNKVWDDSNADGKQDSDEVGIENVVVNLLDTTGNIVNTTTTDSNGEYLFDKLLPGEYEIEVVKPTKYIYVPHQDTGDITNDSNTNHTNGKTGVFSVVEDEKNMDIDSALVLPASIGNKVWDDSNTNGKQDSDEVGVKDVVIKLLDKNGNLIKTTTTNSNGEYLFDKLLPGDYIVEVEKPAEYLYTYENKISDTNLDSNINDVTGKSEIVTVIEDEKNMSIDSGIFIPATVSGEVFHDKNINSVQESEDLLSGVPVILYRDGEKIAETTTNSHGAYKFENLYPGDYNYQVEIKQIGKYGDISFNKRSSKKSGISDDINIDFDHEGKTDIFKLSEGEDKTNIDTGFYAQHGGSVRHMDICENGDTSGDYYDGECGEAPENETTIEANNDSKNTEINTPVTINLLDNDSNPDSNSKIVTNINGTDVTPGDGQEIEVEGGVVTLLENGEIKFTPNTDFVGEVNFPYSITDDEGDIDTANVKILIKSVPEVVEEITEDFSEIEKRYKDYLTKKEKLSKIIKDENTIGLGLTAFPRLLPQTGTPIGDRIKTVKNYKVDTDLPNFNIFKLAGNYNKDLDFWKNILPEQDKNKDEYIVIPSNGLVVPVNNVPKDTADFTKMVSGKEIHVNDYLKDGVMAYPESSKNSYGEVGNKVVFGHSSYWKKDDGRYKTHFQKIIELNVGEQVWVYKKINGNFKRFRYLVEKSYNTPASDTSVLKSGIGSNLTLFTCTPIGGIKGRWIVKAKYINEDKKALETELNGLKVSSKYKRAINNFVRKISKIKDDKKKKSIILKIYNKINIVKEKKNNPKIIAILDYLQLKLVIEFFKKI